MPRAARLANTTAGIAAGKLGTAVVHPADLLGAIQARVRLSLALADASGRGEPLPARQPMGHHYYRQSAADSVAALDGLLSLFPPGAVAAREQVTRLWQLNAWQPPLVLLPVNPWVYRCRAT